MQRIRPAEQRLRFALDLAYRDLDHLSGEDLATLQDEFQYFLSFTDQKLIVGAENVVVERMVFDDAGEKRIVGVDCPETPVVKELVFDGGGPFALGDRQYIASVDARKLTRKRVSGLQYRVREYLESCFAAPLRNQPFGDVVLKFGPTELRTFVSGVWQKDRALQRRTMLEISGKVEDCFLYLLARVVEELDTRVATRVTLCPEKKCGRVFYRVGTQKYCSRRCANRASYRAWYGRQKTKGENSAPSRAAERRKK